MAESVYALCALTSLACTVFLIRSYLRTRLRLLFWSAICFTGFAFNNGLLFVDLIVIPTGMDLSLWRLVPAFAGTMVMIFGLIWEAI